MPARVTALERRAPRPHPEVFQASCSVPGGPAAGRPTFLLAVLSTGPSSLPWGEAFPFLPHESRDTARGFTIVGAGSAESPDNRRGAASSRDEGFQPWGCSHRELWLLQMSLTQQPNKTQEQERPE